MSFISSSVASSDLETCLNLVHYNGRSGSSIFNKKLLIGLFAGISVSVIVVKVTKRIMGNCKKKRELVKLKDLKEKERQENFQRIRSHLQSNGKTDEHNEILSLPLEELCSKLQTRQLRAKVVVEAYIMRALELAEELNCISEFLPSALDTAVKLDNMVLVQGPLHGVPFCVNDDIDLAGLWSSYTCSTNLPASCPSTDSAVMVKILETQGGAIPFCRTSTSITCLSFGGRNPFYGEIHNPINKKLSIGGSSSGTASLVKGGGAPFGIGTDRAGGARLPAHFSGITTLKPSRHRVSRRGCIQHCVGTTSVPCIMTKRVNDLMTLSRLVMEKNHQNKYDPKAVPLPWNTQICESKQKLRIGFFTYVPAYPPLGDTEEALKKARMYLESCGHIVVNCEPPDDLKCQEVWTDLMKVHTHRHLFQGGSKSISSSSKNLNNSHIHQISPRVLWADDAKRVRKSHNNGGSFWKRFTGSFEHIPGRRSSEEKAIEHLRATMNSDCDLWSTASLREQFVDEVLDNMNTVDVDVIICPAFGVVATTSENMMEVGLLPGVYTFVWNLLDLPCGVVKVWRESGKYLNSKYEDSIGMPIGIQVIGRPYAEEMVLRVMNELDELNDDNDNHTGSVLRDKARKESRSSSS